MDSELLKILSEEILETRNLTIETRKQVEETKRLADKAEKKADAAWELVVMTRNQIKEELAYMRLPWWKKLVGATT
jgi:hypothetical protein